MNRAVTLFVLFAFTVLGGCSNHNSSGEPQSTSQDIEAIFNKEIYQNSTWALRVVDMASGEIVYDQSSDEILFIGSVRKVFTIAEALEALGPEYTFRTPVHRRGRVTAQGVLEGDLILVASGDFTMGGRRSSDGTMATTNLDHNDANTLGNAELTTPDPLWGYNSLAEQVAASGVTSIEGDIIIDDRLFQPFPFRGEFDVRPIFVNDDAVDVMITPTSPGALASVEYRPKSQAFSVESNLLTVSPDIEADVELVPELPDCIGSAGCSGAVIGSLPVDFDPPLTGTFPLVQTFRIVEPQNYARTVFIEALERAGITVSNANPVGPNRSSMLPLPNTYTGDTLLAELVSLPFSEYAKFVLKVSYNIGSDTSLVLWGLTEGVDNMEDSLMRERENLTQNIGIAGDEFLFVDGSGGGLTTASINAIIRMLEYSSEQSFFPELFQALPVLGVDGSLAFANEFESDPTLAGAKGNAFAKTGTYAVGNEIGILLKGRSMAGFIDTKGGRRLVYSVVVNDVQLEGYDIENLLTVSSDQATITAILWRDN
jgi:D-alanyl-D-alanine carboxypeptidase